jgi:hypothetical protein
MASQSIVPVVSGNPIRNGSIVVFVQKTGGYQTSDPAINHYENSGQLSARMAVRFDEHYMGGIVRTDFVSSGCC